MHPVKKSIVNAFKQARTMQKDRSYTTDADNKLVEHLTHAQSMHQYENLIDGTCTHTGALYTVKQLKEDPDIRGRNHAT